MDYATKFKDLIRLCEETKASGVDVLAIHHPEVLGDAYDELVESLNRISDAGLRLMILPRRERG